MAGLHAPVAAYDVHHHRSWVNARVIILIASIPLFGQFFHYMKDLPPLWALSKLWPLLSLPCALALVVRPRPACTRQILLCFLWLVLVSSIAAMFSFDQSFIMGLTAQIKLLPMLSFFGLLGLLAIVRPTCRDIMIAVLAWGAATIAITIMLGLFAPQTWYSTTYEIGDAPLLSNDGRGNRIRMPMIFALIFIFFAWRRGISGRDWRWIGAAVLGIVVAVALVKTRATVVALAAALALVSWSIASRRWRIVALAAAPVAILALFQIPYVASILDTSAQSGIDVRVTTINKAIDFLGDNPFAWLLGVGTISSVNPAGLIEYFSHFFFLADISWLGIVFEFGLIGAALLLTLPLRAYVRLRRLNADGKDHFLGALRDYILFVVLISPLYPILTLQPGEVTSILAITVYVGWLAEQRPPAPAL